jgi:integrase
MAWLYKRGKIWWIGWMARGKQYLQSTGASDEEKAKLKLKEVEFAAVMAKAGRLDEKCFESWTGKVLPRATLKGEIESWLAEARGANSDSTFKRYEKIATRLCEYLKADDAGPLLREVTADQVRAYLAHRRSAASAETVNLERKILSSFFTRPVKSGTLQLNPVLQVKRFKESKDEKRRRRPFTLSELKLIYSKAPDDFWRYMIVGGFFSGLRLGDLIMLRIGEADLGANVLRFVTRKTHRNMTIPLAAQFREAIALRIKGCNGAGPDRYLWPEQADRYQKHGAKVFSNEFYSGVLVPAGLALPRTHAKQEGKNGRAAPRALGISFHCLRHSFVSFLKATGGNQAVAKELAGHSSDVVNDMYTHLPVETLSHAINRLPGLAFTGDLFDGK